jgi:hypothetical protein
LWRPNTRKVSSPNLILKAKQSI